RWNDTNAFQRSGIVPGMVVKADATIALSPFGFGDFQSLTNGRFTHRLVRAERDEVVERLRHFAQLPVKCLKEQPHGRGARPVRDNEQNSFVAIILGGARFLDKVADLSISKRAG